MPSEPTLAPKQLPSAGHEVIAVLESIHVPWEEFDSTPSTHEVLLYKYSNPDDDDVAARVRDASMVISSICRLTAETLRQAPYLKCVISHAVGTDHIDLIRSTEGGRGNIQVMTCTGCNAESVAEHALALYFAARSSLVSIQNTLTDFGPGRPNDWKSKGSLNAIMRDGTGALPRTCSQETAGIIGYGAVGKHIAKLCRALGMKVVVSRRKGSSSNDVTTLATTGEQQPPRAPFADVLTQATVLFLALPFTPESAGLISAAELARMRPDAVVANVSRGGIVDEAAMVDALRSRALFGYGTDVFAREPAGNGDDSPLLGEGAKGLNLTLTSHLAWFSGTTVLNQVRRVKENLRAFLDGAVGPDGIVVQRDFTSDIRPGVTAP
ncbi:glycerate dehydrogenase [Diaporthe helianthi]|uniref:Glycerate dehydrogenase n=1 Tax=Diaporthe helianthi TaxID=158607 RepID=A0A2P5HN99_DIAHE|nr:glycerate dehydrogenase [Diaporthe helianthi]